jgi:hypothetical protein
LETPARREADRVIGHELKLQTEGQIERNGVETCGDIKVNGCFLRRTL